MRVALEALGCRLNDAELEVIEQALRAAGHEIVKSVADPEVIVINSCGVTGAAMRKSRNLARRRLSTQPALLVLMGCAVDLTSPNAGLIPDTALGATQVIQIRRDDKDRAAEIIATAIDKLPKHEATKGFEQTLSSYHAHTRRFIKIQDGCNNQCSYCSVRIARGREQSVSMQEVLDNIRSISESGTAEAILTGVQLGAWNEGGLKLPDLIEAILNETKIARLRLSSIEPWHLSDALWKQWTQSTRLCPHFHVPIQSGSPEILRAMRRRGDHAAYLEKIVAMRSEIPNLRLSTDIITGFPGESDVHWQESMDFLRRASLDDVHLFSFSARPGTPAEALPHQTSSEQRRERLHEAQTLVEAIKRERTRAFIGTRFDVLWESAGPAKAGMRLWQGYTDNYLRVQRLFPDAMGMRGKVSEIVFGDELSDLD